MPPRFSIITVTRNHAEGLRSTLESIASQTSRNFELIVVDGHSTDATPKVLQDFSSLPLRVFQDSKMGIYAAMNQGVKEASGEWVIFMNAGDRFYDGSTLEHCRTPPGSDLVYGRAWREDRSAPFSYRPFDEIWKGNVFCHQALFARSELLRRFPFREDLRIVADYAFYIDCLKAGCQFTETDIDVAVIEPGGISAKQALRRTIERYHVARDAFPGKPVRRYYLDLILRQLTGFSSLRVKARLPRALRSLVRRIRRRHHNNKFEA